MKQQAKIKGVNLCEVSMVDQKQVRVIVDKSRIQHILQNLLMTQIDQMNEGGNVVFQTNEHRIDEHNTTLKFCLINDEEFLDERDLNLIYNSAVCTDKAKQIELSGLNQCNQSIKKMGGSMDIRPGKHGCEIQVSLPVQIQCTDTAALEMDALPCSRIEHMEEPMYEEFIIAEDLLINRELLKDYLQNLNFLSRCVLLNKHEEAFAQTVKILSEESDKSFEKPWQPVKLLLIDILPETGPLIGALKQYLQQVAHLQLFNSMLLPPKIVFTCGFPARLVQHLFAEYGDFEIYEKPL
jgi:hypothetical protein